MSMTLELGSQMPPRDLAPPMEDIMLASPRQIAAIYLCTSSLQCYVLLFCNIHWGLPVCIPKSFDNEYRRDENMKSKMLLLCVSVLVVLGLIACSEGTSKKVSSEGEDGQDQELADKLYVFNWAGYIPQEVLDEFEEEYDVELVYDTFSANQEMLTKIKSGAVKYDVVFPTDYFLKDMGENDLLQEINLDNIPNFENIEEDLKDQDFDPGNKYSVPFMYGSIGLAYNKEKVEEPSSWEDLWNPEYKGHVTMQETPKEAISIALQTLGYDFTNPTDEQLGEAKERLEGLNENVLTYTSQPNDVLINEQAWISATYGDQAGKAILQNPDISYVIPEEGGILWMDNIAIPEISENKYTAEVFINFLLDAEISKKITDYSPGSNPNAAARELMDSEELDNPAAYPDIPEKAVYFEVLDPDTLEKFNKTFKEVKVQ